MMTIPANKLYWDFTGSWQDEYPGGKLQRRWVVDKRCVIHHLELKYLWEAARPLAESEWDPDTRIECYGKGPVEDMPWVDCLGIRPLVSDRLRQLLERLAPGHAQYLPVKLTLRRKVLKLPPYWFMNPLREVDCYHREETEWITVRGKPMIHVFVLDSDRVPPDVSVFMVAHNLVEGTIIRDSIRRAIEEAGMTGCQFIPLYYKSPFKRPEIGGP